MDSTQVHSHRYFVQNIHKRRRLHQAPPEEQLSSILSSHEFPKRTPCLRSKLLRHCARCTIPGRPRGATLSLASPIPVSQDYDHSIPTRASIEHVGRIEAHHHMAQTWPRQYPIHFHGPSLSADPIVMPGYGQDACLVAQGTICT